MKLVGNGDYKEGTGAGYVMSCFVLLKAKLENGASAVVYTKLSFERIWYVRDEGKLELRVTRGSRSVGN